MIVRGGRGAWRVERWRPDEVRITGLWGGWTFGLGLSIGTLPLLISSGIPSMVAKVVGSPWIFAAILVGWVLGWLGQRFDVHVVPDGVHLRHRLCGMTLRYAFVRRQALVLDLYQAWDDPRPSGVELYSDEGVFEDPNQPYFVMGDEYVADDLYAVLRAAVLHVHAHQPAHAASLLLTTSAAHAVEPPTDTDARDPDALPDGLFSILATSTPVIVAEGWTAFDSQTVCDAGGPRVRTGIFVMASSPRLVWDGYLRPSDLESLVDAIEAQTRVVRGGWDEMALTHRRRYLWTNEPFRLWKRGRLIAARRGDALWTARETVPLRAIVEARPWVSETWSRVGVELVLNDHSTRLLTWSWNLDAILDPFYDGIDLDFDVEWAEKVSAAVCRRTQDAESDWR